MQGDFTYMSGLAAAEQLLALPKRPTVIFASNDDTTAASTLWPPLTTIHQPVRALAAEALSLLIAEIAAKQDKSRVPRESILGHRLVERQSTGALPPSAPS